MKKIKNILSKKSSAFALLVVLIGIIILIELFVIQTSQRQTQAQSEIPVSNTTQTQSTVQLSSPVSMVEENKPLSFSIRESLEKIYDLTNFDWVSSSWSDEKDLFNPGLDMIINKSSDSNFNAYELQFIRDYYLDISWKRFTSATKQGVDGLTEADYENKYRDIAYMFPSFVKYLGADNVQVDLILFDKIGSVLKISKENLKVDVANKKILSITSEMQEVNVLIDCSSNDPTVCVVRDQNTRELIRFAFGHSSPLPQVKLGKIIDQNNISIIEDTGEGEHKYLYIIMKYDINLRSIVLLDLLRFTNPLGSGVALFEDCPGTDKHFESAVHNLPEGCLYEKYKDEQWLQDNVYYFQNVEKYMQDPWNR